MLITILEPVFSLKVVLLATMLKTQPRCVLQNAQEQLLLTTLLEPQ